MRGISQPPLTNDHNCHKISIPVPILRTLHADENTFLLPVLPSFFASLAWLLPPHGWPLCFPPSGEVRLVLSLMCPFSFIHCFDLYHRHTEEPSYSDSYPKSFSPSRPPPRADSSEEFPCPGDPALRPSIFPADSG